MNDRKQRKAAREFAAKWAGKGYEKGESQLFWITLLHDVFGVEDVSSGDVFRQDHVFGKTDILR